MPPGRPAKPNVTPKLIRMDNGVWSAVDDAAKVLKLKRSALLEMLAVKYLPGHVARHWKAEDKAKPSPKPNPRRKP